MELHETDLFPHVVDFLLWILIIGRENTGVSCKVLEVPHEDLRFAVSFLVSSLGRVCSTMKLEVKFAVPGNEFLPSDFLLLEDIKELVDRFAHVDSRKQSDLIAEASTASELFDMLNSRTATSIPFTKDEEGSLVLVKRFVLGNASHDVSPVCLGGIGFTRRHMRKDLGTVEGDPIERCMLELINIVPRPITQPLVIRLATIG